MDGQRFDQLARRLAAATSRRQVLKSFAAGLGATLLGISGTSAQGNGGNSDCAHFCKTVFSPGRARGQCTSDAAHGQGLCPVCGADASRVCVAPDGIASCPDRSTDPLNCGNCNVVCPSGACVAGTCLKPNGDACAVGNDCLSTICADGVCCDNACTGQCEACDATGACLPVAGPPVGSRSACASDGSVCGGACDGVDPTGCVYPGNSVTCADPVCRDGDAVPFVCDGGGACVGGAHDECGLFVCRDGACLNACENNDDCIGRAYCEGGACTADKENGQPCTGRDECASGSCVAGVCCGTNCPAPANGTATCSGGACGFACDADYKACDDGCIAAMACCAQADCGAGAICRERACVTCASGSTPCGGACVGCSGGTIDAECNCTCPTGTTLCNGACIDLASFQTDNANCGACGIACHCGGCLNGTCLPGIGVTCGAPGNRCGWEEICVGGSCQCGTGPACGTSGCCEGGSCRCGAGPACGSGQHCSRGVCCPTGQIACDGTCLDTSNDPKNCGPFCVNCGAGATCSNGLCVCSPGAGPCQPIENCRIGTCQCGDLGESCTSVPIFKHCHADGGCYAQPDPQLSSIGRGT